jgi:hypothetical protein
MNDLEELLRTDLARAAEPIDSDLDADELIEAGQRVRRSRTMRVGAGLTAVLVATAGLGLVIVNNVHNGGRGPVLASPSPSPSVPASTSAGPTSTSVTRGTATFDLTGFSMNKTDAPFDQLVVEAAPTGTGKMSITVTGSTPGRADQQVIAQFGAGGTSATFVTLGKRVVVALLPGTATSAELFTDLNVGGRVSDTKALPGAGLTAHVTVFEHAATDTTTDPEVIWQTPDGALHATSGAEVPSAAVMFGTQQVRVFRSTEVGSMGLWGRGELGGTSVEISDAAPSDLIGGGLGHGPDKPSTEWTWVKFAALPPGSTDIQLSLNPKATSSEWKSVTLSDGWVMVIAVLHGSEKLDPIVVSADYVDASGTAVHLGK